MSETQPRIETPLRNPKYEIVAQELARGRTQIEASLAAGYTKNGPAFAANCRQRANYPPIKARVAALRAAALEKVEMDIGGLVKALWEMATRPPYKERVTTQDRLRAIDMLLRMGGHYAPTRSIVTRGPSQTVRLTETFDANGLKSRRRVVDLIQVINDESCPVEERLAAAKAAVPLLEGKYEDASVTEQ